MVTPVTPLFLMVTPVTPLFLALHNIILKSLPLFYMNNTIYSNIFMNSFLIQKITINISNTTNRKLMGEVNIQRK